MLARILLAASLALTFVSVLPTASADSCAVADPDVEAAVCPIVMLAYTPIAWGNCIGSEWKDVSHDVACVRGKG